jgi:hypothetical protein
MTRTFFYLTDLEGSQEVYYCNGCNKIDTRFSDLIEDETFVDIDTLKFWLLEKGLQSVPDLIGVTLDYTTTYIDDFIVVRYDRKSKRIEQIEVLENRMI